MNFVQRLILSLFVCVSLVTQAAARPSIVVDATNGTIIAGEDIDQRWHPASLTKLMTALVVFRMLERGEVTLASHVKVSALALKQQPSKMSYPVGTSMRLGDALPMMIVKSANDISVAIAESTLGSVSNFVAEMNREAFRLGLANTVFTNPTGLHDERQFTSARDLAIIATEIRRSFPQYAEYYTHDAIKVGKNTLPSFNLLIGRFNGADGMKTGFVCASGYNQVGSATRDGRTIIGVVLGRGSQDERAEDLAALLTQGFEGTGSSPLAGGTPSTDGPPNIRTKTCPNGGPPAEDAKLSEPNSPYLVRKPSEIVNPLRIQIGKPDGPIPAAAAAFFGGKKAKGDIAEKPVEKSVPVPTPRPNYTPPQGSKAEIRGTLPAKQP
jgi:D-alanyl-D-alanine carboxypeptidase